MSARDAPLCVDLDGTLVRTDLLFESCVSLLASHPQYLLVLPLWLLRGRAHLKRRIAERVQLDTGSLPYDERLLDWLQSQAGQREIVLCTASDQSLAELVAARVGCFSTVLGSDGRRNLKGEHKADALCVRYGERGFDYAGDSRADLAVWRKARRAVVVNAAPALVHEAAQVCDVERVFPRKDRPLRTWPGALRLHQWLKNLLVFLPLLAAHRLFDRAALEKSALAFLAFGLCASGTYLLNDLLDLEADRRHPRKRQRPFASGSLSPAQGAMVMPVMIVAAFLLALTLSGKFALVLLSYLIVTLAYSLRLKRVAMLDVVVLAALYTVRIVAGTVAVHANYSFWLLAFSMFIFLSLAMLKRYTELLTLLDNGHKIAGGRGYAVDDLSLIQSLGAASGYISVLVLALYINSTASQVLYHRPHVLWLICPLLLYWISRAWMMAHHRQMHDDPIVFAVSDRVSLASLALVLAAVVTAL